MNNLKETRRVLDYIWERLITKIAPSAGTRYGNPLVGFPLVIDTPITIYVETWGDDQSDGSSPLKPFRTVQAALDWLRPFIIQANVTVQIGPGTFDGFEAPNLNISTGGPGFIPIVTVQGTLTTYATGTATGGSPGVLNDTTRAWAVNELKDKLIQMGVSTTRQWIHDNTATSLTTVGNTNPAAGSIYTISQIATHIAVNKLRGTSGTSMTGIWNANQMSGSPTTAPYILYKNLEIGSVVAGPGYCVLSHGGSLTMAECQFTVGGTVLAGVHQTGQGGLSFNRCLFDVTATSGTAISTFGPIYAATASLFRGTGLPGQRGIFSFSGAHELFSACLFDSLGMAIGCLSTSQGVFGCLSGTFVSCTIGIDLQGPSTCVIVDSAANLPGFPFVSANNGTFIKVTHPSTVGVRSNVPSGLATTDIDLHGETASLATMRTAGVFPASPSAMGSRVYGF